MCTITSEALVASRSFRIYKVVSIDAQGQRGSQFTPKERGWITRSRSRGEWLQYPVGAQVKSPCGPGIMGYRTRRDAEQEAWNGSLYDQKQVVVLRVPQGTKYRLMENNGRDGVCAQKVEVLT